ncbi:hypothetical protein, partial [Pectobacterium odoriferum]|uniref:hypothetical protein n=1 Tax=Pectobacterium odoriferum TaxID=78398 RepID=UPI000D473949
PVQPIYVLVKFVSRSVPILSLVFSMGVTTILTEGVYRQAQKAHPERWSGKTRNWQPEGPVTLNPEREKQAA